jgi:sulfide:quinone oxidoreductase
MHDFSARREAESFDVLIVGGGNAGISTAARLIRRGLRDVAVIEPNAVHTYRPLLSYVGAGQADMRRAERTQRSVTPRGCTWLRDSVVAVDANGRTVTCASGATFGYRDLVLAPGLVPDDDALPGIAAAIASPGVASNYLDHAEKTWDLVRDMPNRGRAVFTVPRVPVSCTGTTFKPLFLSASYWERTLTRAAVDITLVVDRPSLMDVTGLDERLHRRLDDLGVRVLLDTAVTALHPAQRQVTVSDRDETETRLSYDMLHLVPPFRGPQWLVTSDLATTAGHGLVDVDPRTFKHRVHEGIWALGDGASVETDPSGGALRRQTTILVGNLLASRGDGQSSIYDGYTVAPIATDAHRLIAAEYDRTGALASSLPSFVDPLTPRRTAWAFDRYALPQLYWNLILRGLA